MTSPPVEYLEAPPVVLIVLDDLRRFEQLVARLDGDEERIGLRKPKNADQPWCRVRTAGGGFALDAARGAWSQLVQVEVCATRPVGPNQELPELFTMRVAGLVAAHFTHRRAQTFQGASWRARYFDGPADLTESSRGDDAPVYKQAVRLDVRMHAHVLPEE